MPKGENFANNPGRKDSHPNWKGGVKRDSKGYLVVWQSTRKYKRLSVVCAEKALGRPLPSGVVIHHYGDRDENNKIVICPDQSYHQLLHIRTKAFKETGDPNKRWCAYCKNWDDVTALTYNKSSRYHFHKNCANKRARETRNGKLS